MTTELHLILFPYFLFPFLSIAMTASVFMTVGIALERYIAVHYPINYSQAMMQANALNKRVSKYVITVTALSVLFSVNKFFEAR